MELDAETGGKARILLPYEVRGHFRKLFANDARVIKAVLPLVAAFERPTGGRTPQRHNGKRAVFGVCLRGAVTSR